MVARARVADCWRPFAVSWTVVRVYLLQVHAQTFSVRARAAESP